MVEMLKMAEGWEGVAKNLACLKLMDKMEQNYRNNK